MICIDQHWGLFKGVLHILYFFIYYIEFRSSKALIDYVQ